MIGYLWGTADRPLADHETVKLEVYHHTLHGHVHSVQSNPAGPGFLIGLELVVPDDLREYRPPGMDGPACIVCGGMTRRTGTCYTCIDCATTTGCG